MRGRLNLQGRTATQLEMFPQWGAGPMASRQKPANDDSPFEQVGRAASRALAATDDRFKVGFDDARLVQREDARPRFRPFRFTLARPADAALFVRAEPDDVDPRRRAVRVHKGAHRLDL